MNITIEELLKALKVHSELRLDPVIYVATSTKGYQFHVTPWDACKIAAEYISRRLAQDAEPVASDSLGQPDNLEVIIDAFIEDYEMVGETEDGRDACHTPTDGERALIKDAICGLLADTDWDNAWGNHLKSLAHPPEAAQTDEREAFEAWWDSGYTGCSNSGPWTHNTPIQWAWDAWRAGRKG